MDATLAKSDSKENLWGGGQAPMRVSYGKMMIWFFLASDALTFTSFVLGYGFARFKYLEIWPIADEVFNEVPFLHDVEAPMIYTAFMTFVLIFSSVTMVLAVHYGRMMDKKKVTFYMALTILGGLIFIGSQVNEWAGFIKGSHGAIETINGKVVHVYNTEGKQVKLKDVVVYDPSYQRAPLERDKAGWFTKESYLESYSINEVKTGFMANENLLIRFPNIDENGHKVMLSREESVAFMNKDAVGIVEGANLKHNEYGPPLFADFFFFITGFHGFHVSIGITLLIITFFNVVLGTYERRGHYEMVEKIGLYWHFVDLVWVFVFTFFYLV